MQADHHHLQSSNQDRQARQDEQCIAQIEVIHCCCSLSCVKLKKSTLPGASLGVPGVPVGLWQAPFPCVANLLLESQPVKFVQTFLWAFGMTTPPKFSQGQVTKIHLRSGTLIFTSSFHINTSITHHSSSLIHKFASTMIALLVSHTSCRFLPALKHA